jgi:hypothetical protein
VNTALLVLSSALASGGDVVPAGWGERAPVVVQAGGCDPCAPAGREKLLDRMKSKFGAHAPACCDPCANSYAPPNLLDTIKGRMAKGGFAASASGCGAGPSAPAAVAVTPGAAPKEMPRDLKGSGNSNAPPAGVASPVPLAPLTPLPPGPVSEPRRTSPY